MTEPWHRSTGEVVKSPTVCTQNLTGHGPEQHAPADLASSKEGLEKDDLQKCLPTPNFLWFWDPPHLRGPGKYMYTGVSSLSASDKS